MPHLKIGTNVPRSKVSPGLVHELCQTLADSIGKPQEVCHVTLSTDKLMSVGGTDAPSAQATLMSIGNLGVKENKVICRAISDKLQSSLGIAPEHTVIHFLDALPHEIGWKGTTCENFVRIVAVE